MTVIVEPPSAQINRKSRKNVEMIVAYRNIRKKVDCVEAQRIMYILNQLQRRLLLLGKHFKLLFRITFYISIMYKLYKIWYNAYDIILQKMVLMWLTLKNAKQVASILLLSNNLRKFSNKKFYENYPNGYHAVFICYPNARNINAV